MWNRLWAVMLLLILILITSLSEVQANSAPVQESTVHATGNIELLRKSNIKLEEEVLNIRLDGVYADVSVCYRYFNAGPQDRVAYGFPLDEYEYAYKYNDPRASTSFTQFKIVDDTGELNTSQMVENNPNISNKRGYGPVQRRWFISEMDFPAYSEKNVQVSYRVKNFFFSKTSKVQLATFTYYLSPSRYWGDGTVNRFRVVVDARKNIQEGTVMKAMSLPFRDDGGVYVYEANRFDLSKAENLVIEYDETSKFRSPSVRFWTENTRNNIKSVRTSSALAGNYSADNLLDGDLDTAWVEGAVGYGEGEWLEIEFKSWYNRGIGIINGYTKTQETYYKNSRIKKLKIELFQEDGRIIQQIKDLPDRDYRTLNKSAFWSFVDKLDYDSSAALHTTKIRLTIMEVYPGTDYQDTCISEVFFYP